MYGVKIIYVPHKHFWGEIAAKRLFHELYNVLIGKPLMELVKNITLLHDLPFHDELNITRISQAIKRYAKSYQIEIIDPKALAPLAQLEVSKSNFKDLFKDVLDEIKGFKYQITIKFLLSKHKENGCIELDPAYFKSTTKIVINLEYDLDKSFQQILYRIDNWINEGPNWVIESVDAEYGSISIYSQFIVNRNLRHSMKGITKIKNNKTKCFVWCHKRYLKPLKMHPERMTKSCKNMVNDLNYKGIDFLSLKIFWQD